MAALARTWVLGSRSNILQNLSFACFARCFFGSFKQSKDARHLPGFFERVLSMSNITKQNTYLIVTVNLTVVV
jgi:hypothetical protein